MTVFFGDESFLKLERQDGHFYVRLRVIYTGGDIDGVEVPFILDTGAFLTVISRVTAVHFGFDKLPKAQSKIKGYSGEETADFIRIPSLKVLDSLITDIPVLIPHNRALKQNILGLNVLEYFNYHVDTENDKFYLSVNPNPRHYNDMLACGGIFEIKPNDLKE